MNHTSQQAHREPRMTRNCSKIQSDEGSYPRSQWFEGSNKFSYIIHGWTDGHVTLGAASHTVHLRELRGTLPAAFGHGHRQSQWTRCSTVSLWTGRWRRSLELSAISVREAAIPA